MVAVGVRLAVRLAVGVGLTVGLSVGVGVAAVFELHAESGNTAIHSSSNRAFFTVTSRF